MPEAEIARRITHLESLVEKQTRQLDAQDKSIQRLNDRVTLAAQKNIGLESVSQHLNESLMLTTQALEKQQQAMRTMLLLSGQETQADIDGGV
jgi:adenylosuccinate synthase